MRARLFAATLAALAVPAAAENATWLLQPGLYCPAGADVLPLMVTPRGGLLVDGLDCHHLRLEGGRVRSPACHANGGSIVPLDTDLLVLPSGGMVHDGVTFWLWPGPRPCPKG